MALVIQWEQVQDDPDTVLDIGSEFAVLRLFLTGEVIQRCEWRLSPVPTERSVMPLQRQVKQYLERPAPDGFELTLRLRKQGTEFMRNVWMELGKIPFGQTLTYGQLAHRTGSGARAVANACRHNPFPGLIPCHRVVSVNGIGGFMGQRSGCHVDLKRSILQFEAANTGRHEYPFD